jgi:acetate---CoA ligase (ADP-forming)
VLANLSSAIDQPLATDLRARGIPVLEGTRSGLRALAHLRAHASRVDRVDPADATLDERRRAHWTARLATGAVDVADLLADYGIHVAAARAADSEASAVAAADALGYPVVLKTADPDIHHKVDLGGVCLGLADADAVRTAWAALAARLGPCVTVQEQAPAGVEMALGLWRDPLLGPLVLVAAGGTLVELLDHRAVALPPVGPGTARRLVASLRISRVLAGHRGSPAVDVHGLVAAVVAMSALACELGDHLDAVDVNPLVVHPDGAVAVDGLVVPRMPGGQSG